MPTRAHPDPSPRPAPTLWLLFGPKAGDNAQLQAIADALAARMRIRIEHRRLAFHAGELFVSLAQTPSLAGLSGASAQGLGPPWPDLILSSGRRNEPVARWIQRRTAGRCLLVHVGRPWADPRRYDLVITTPQYFLDAWSRGRIRRLVLPPVPAIAADGPRDPALALLVGGDSGSQLLTAEAARSLGVRVRELADQTGLGLRVSTSARTPPAAEAALRATLATARDLEFFSWHGARQAGAGGADNPYRAWIGSSSAFVVTADSISMVADAAAQGRPLWLAPLPRATRPWWATLRGWRWKALTHELAQRLAPRRFRRDTRRLLQGLVDARRAAWLGEPGPAEADAMRAGEDARTAATAIVALLSGRDERTG